MTPPVAAEWWDNVRRRHTDTAQANLMALMYFGYDNQPKITGPRVVVKNRKSFPVELITSR